MTALDKRISISANSAFLNELAHDEIATISSYLSLNNYINLALCNRLMYSYLISKPRFIPKITLNKNHIIKYYRHQKNKSTQPNLFKFVNSITLDVSKMSESNQTFFPNVHILEVWLNGGSDDIQLLKDINCESINELSLCVHGDPRDIRIWTLLSKMKNMQYIALNMDDYQNFEACLTKLYSCKNLKGIKTVVDIPQLIDVYKHQLESLHIWSCDNLIQYPKEKLFSQLKELCLLYRPRDYTVLETFTTCSMLKRVHISFENQLGEDDIKFLNDLCALKSLNFISIFSDNCNNNILSILIKAASTHEKKRLKIRLALPNGDYDDVMSKMDGITKLITQMNKYTEHFMFIFEFKDSLYLKLFTQLQSVLNNKLGRQLLINWSIPQRFSDNCIKRRAMIVSNYNCNICGYKERWVYDTHCPFCAYCLL